MVSSLVNWFLQVGIGAFTERTDVTDISTLRVFRVYNPASGFGRLFNFGQNSNRTWITYGISHLQRLRRIRGFGTGSERANAWAEKQRNVLRHDSNGVAKVIGESDVARRCREPITGEKVG
jgi:hypothetical protein